MLTEILGFFNKKFHILFDITKLYFEILNFECGISNCELQISSSKLQNLAENPSLF